MLQTISKLLRQRTIVEISGKGRDGSRGRAFDHTAQPPRSNKMGLTSDMAQDCAPCVRDVFGTLADDELQRLQEAARIIQRPAGHLIFEEGDSAIEGYCICSGAVEIFKRMERGGALVLRTADAKSLIGMKEILTEQRAYRTSARALFDVRLLGIPREEILRLAQTSSTFSYAVAQQLCNEMIELRREHTTFVEKPLSDRLQAKLRQLADKYGSPTDGWIEIELKLTNAELAELIGTTSGTVSMLLRELKDQGIVKRKGQRFLIRQSEGELQHTT